MSSSGTKSILAVAEFKTDPCCVAAKELNSSYFVGETLLITICTRRNPDENPKL